MNTCYANLVISIHISIDKILRIYVWLLDVLERALGVKHQQNENGVIYE